MANLKHYASLIQIFCRSTYQSHLLRKNSNKIRKTAKAQSNDDVRSNFQGATCVILYGKKLYIVMGVIGHYAPYNPIPISFHKQPFLK